MFNCVFLVFIKTTTAGPSGIGDTSHDSSFDTDSDVDFNGFSVTDVELEYSRKCRKVG